MHKVALLKGGINSENNVSLKTAEACSYALKKLKYELVEIDIKDQFISKIIDGKVSKCFNITWFLWRKWLNTRFIKLFENTIYPFRCSSIKHSN